VLCSLACDPDPTLSSRTQTYVGCGGVEVEFIIVFPEVGCTTGEEWAGGVGTRRISGKDEVLLDVACKLLREVEKAEEARE